MCLQKLRLGIKYDAVLADIHAPGLNGLDLIREVKSINPNISVLGKITFGTSN